MKKKSDSVLFSEMLQKVATKIGAKVLLEPTWNIVGQITFKNGKRAYFRHNTLDLNTMGASAIAKDKDYANFFMRSIGYPIVPGSKTFFSDQWAKAIGMPKRNIEAAYVHAQKIGLPVIVKPNSGSQGTGVALVHTKREFNKALKYIFKKDNVAIVQKPVKGRDYRIVVLDDTIISAYERIPLSIIGDGTTSIKKLLKRKQKEFEEEKRDTSINPDDDRITQRLARQGLTLNSVPVSGQKVQLLDNANLSTGGDSVDVTKSVHPEFKKVAISLTKDMGLRLCGVDLMTEDTIAEIPSQYWVLEINSAPGLDHYAKTGMAQQKIVEALYVKVLQHIQDQ